MSDVDVSESPASAFGRGLAERHRPGSRLAAGIVRRSRPGDLALGVGRFGTRLGLSQTSRWALEGRAAGGRNVRPPIDYWPWADQADADPARVQRATASTSHVPAQPAAARIESSGDSKVDRLRQLLAGPPVESAAAVSAAATGAADAPVQRSFVSPSASGSSDRWDGPAPRIHRGLPRTLARRGSSSLGSIEHDAAAVGMPGTVVRRAQPETIDPSRLPPRDAVQRAPRGRDASASSSARARPGGATPSSASASAGTPSTSSASSTRRAADRDGAPGPASPPLRVSDAPVADLVARRTAAVVGSDLPRPAAAGERPELWAPARTPEPSSPSTDGTQTSPRGQTAPASSPEPVVRRAPAAQPAHPAAFDPEPTATVAQRPNAPKPPAPPAAFNPGSTATVPQRPNARTGDRADSSHTEPAGAPPARSAFEPEPTARVDQRSNAPTLPAGERVVRRRRTAAPAVPSGPAWRSAPRPARSMSAVLPTMIDTGAPTSSQALPAPGASLGPDASLSADVSSRRVRPLALVVNESPGAAVETDADTERAPDRTSPSPSPSTSSTSPTAPASTDPVVQRATRRHADDGPTSAPTATIAERSTSIVAAPSNHVDRSQPQPQPQPGTSTLAVRPTLSPADSSNDGAASSASASAPDVLRRTTEPDAIARRFAEHVDASPSPMARTLAPRWQPLARAIVGDRVVSVRTDAVARRALADAGKIAATAGNVIHLQREPSSAADAAVLAHELTHVAHPSPAVRFFDDHRPSAEERRAEQVAEMIRRSPVLPHPGGGQPAAASMATAAPPAMAHSMLRHAHDDGEAASGTSSTTLRRTPSGRGTSNTSSSPRQFGAGDTISAAALAARYDSGTDASPTTSVRDEAVVRRRIAASAHRTDHAAKVAATTASRSTTRAGIGTHGASSDQATVRRLIGGHRIAAVSKPVVDDVSPSLPGSPNTSSAQSPDVGEEQWEMLRRTVDSSGVTDLLEWIVDRIEERIGDDLARRGGRHRGAF